MYVTFHCGNHQLQKINELLLDICHIVLKGGLNTRFQILCMTMRCIVRGIIDLQTDGASSDDRVGSSKVDLT